MSDAIEKKTDIYVCCNCEEYWDTKDLVKSGDNYWCPECIDNCDELMADLPMDRI